MQITITRAEGPIHQCGKPVKVESFAEAQSKLWSMSMSAPRNGGYDKCDFVIRDEASDFTYNGRFDLKHYSVESPDLKGHVIDYLRFMGGDACPLHMTEESYTRFLAQHEITPAERQTFLDGADWVRKQP